jgi:hypothetical protein
MKENRVLWVALAVVVLLVALAMIDQAEPADKEIKMAEFKTVFTIIYNSLTLEQAAALEKIVRQQHEKACCVGVSMEHVGTVNTFSGESYWRDGSITLEQLNSTRSDSTYKRF